MVGLTKVVTVLLAIAFVLSLKGRWYFMLDNLSSFKVHFALAFIFCAIFFLVNKEYPWLGVATLCLVAAAIPIVGWYLPMRPETSDGGEIVAKLISVNVSPRNNSPQKLVNLISDEQPDILGLIELNPGYASQLDNVKAEFDYSFESPERGFWGLGLYSKLPIADARLATIGDNSPQAIVATVTVGGRDIEVILIHPYAPLTAKMAADRNRQLDALAVYIADSELPTLVLTDLNTAMWSPYYRDFVKRSDLKNARQGSGVASTWPPSKLLGVPIDHIFYSAGMFVRNFRVLPGVGSDHLPIAAELAFARGSQAMGRKIELSRARPASVSKR